MHFRVLWSRRSSILVCYRANILVRGQTCSKGWSLDCSLQKRPICREGVMEAQRNRGLCNLSKFAATTIIRRLTQSGEWEALDVKECVKALRCEVKLFLLIRVPRSRLLVVWSPSLQLPTMWFSDSPTNCSASTPDFTTSPPLLPPGHPHKAADKSAPLLDRVHNAYLWPNYLLLPHTTW